MIGTTERRLKAIEKWANLKFPQFKWRVFQDDEWPLCTYINAEIDGHYSANLLDNKFVFDTKFTELVKINIEKTKIALEKYLVERT